MRSKRQLPNNTGEPIPVLLEKVMFALHTATEHWIIINIAVVAIFIFAAFLLSLAEAGCLLILCAIFIEVTKQLVDNLQKKADFISELAIQHASKQLVESEGGVTSVGRLTEVLNTKNTDLDQRFGWLKKTYALLWTWELIAVFIGTFFWGFGERIWPT